MAKLFYTLEETAAKLGKSTEEIEALVAAGKLREFRDHESKLMFKMQEVDLLSGDSAGSMELDLGGDLDLGDDGSLGLDLTGTAGGQDAPAKSDAGGKSAADEMALGLDDLALDMPAAHGETLELDVGDGGADKPSLGSGAPFELDLDGADQASKPAGDAMDLELSVDEPAAKPTSGEDFELDLEPSGKDASKGPELDLDVPSPANTESDPFALELDDTEAVTPKPPAAAGAGAAKPTFSEEATLELDLGEDAEPTPASKPGALADSLGSIAAAKAASGGGDDLALDGSNVGATADGSSISDQVGIDGVSSGSGLMDLTNESESSSIGAALMDEAFSSDEGGDLPANASGIFGGSEGGESGAGMATAAAGTAAGMAVAGAVARGKASAPIFTSGPAAAEAYSGSWSGMGVGLLLPASVALGAAAAMMVAKTIGAPTDLARMYAENWTMYTGALAGAVVVSGVIGFFVGKATE